jgi:hypothetical protein
MDKKEFENFIKDYLSKNMTIELFSESADYEDDLGWTGNYLAVEVYLEKELICKDRISL